jgi:EpsI family protein
MSNSAPLSTSAIPVAGANPSEIHSPATPVGTGETPFWRSGFLLILAFLIFLAYWFNPAADVQPQAGVVVNLPILVGDFFGEQGEITDAERNGLPEDTGFARRQYDDGHGRHIQCTIVLSGGQDRSIHRPEACLEGQGWSLEGQDYIPVALASGHPLTAKRLTLEREVETTDGRHIKIHGYYVYWFVGQNITTASHFTRLLLSNWDRAVHNRAHRWAYVSFFTTVTEGLRPDGINDEQTRSMLADFMKQIVPTFQISEMPQQANN